MRWSFQACACARPRYMVMNGEVEVFEKRRTGDDSKPMQNVRLGFLSEGAFFGEAPVLGEGHCSRRGVGGRVAGTFTYFT